jgi:hypothetical protein
MRGGRSFEDKEEEEEEEEEAEAEAEAEEYNDGDGDAVAAAATAADDDDEEYNEDRGSLGSAMQANNSSAFFKGTSSPVSSSVACAL